MYPYHPVLAQAHIDDLHRAAERSRLARLARTDHRRLKGGRRNTRNH
jgi:hypothetical protein